MSIMYAFLIILLINLSKEVIISIPRGIEKCFYDTFYVGNIVIINYEFLEETINMNFFNKTKLPIEIIIKPEVMKVDKRIKVKTFNLDKLIGKLSHAIETSEDYKICISLKNAIYHGNNPVKCKLKIENSNDLLQASEGEASMKDYQSVDQKVKALISNVKMVSNIQKHQSELEQDFSVSQIESNKLIAYLSFFQIAIIFLIGCYHVFSLRKILIGRL